MSTLSAERIILKEYKGSRNFMTPRVLAYYKAGDNRGIELSTGTGLFDQDIWGVSVVDYDPATNTTERMIDVSGVFQSYSEALAYIDELVTEAEDALENAKDKEEELENG
jgi:hypothetical protein